MLAHENICLVIVPPEKMEANLVNEIAPIFQKDVYQTRQMLSGKMPKIVPGYRSPAEAETVANSLKATGLLAFTCEDTFLRRPPSPVFSAAKLSFNEKEVTFQEQSGATRTLAAGEVFLILKGNKPKLIETENSKTVRKLSIGKTILTGGLPIFNKVKQTTTVKSIESLLLLRLYNHASADPIIELSQHNIDYKYLGPKLNYSSLVNFNTVASDIKNAFPGAIYDDRLMQLPRQEESSAPETEFELNCRLLFIYYKTIKENQTEQ